MSSIRIVPATAADVPLIFEMICALAEYEKLAHTVRATEEQLRSTLFGKHPAAEVILAYLDDEFAGFALFFPNYSTFLARQGLYLEDLFVKPHLRQRGVGSALLRHLIDLAADRGYGRVEWSVLDWNEPAIRFYKKIGAVPMDQWTVFRMGE
jgi:GNAT superfamily N-acetyltransferase